MDHPDGTAVPTVIQLIVGHLVVWLFCEFSCFCHLKMISLQKVGTITISGCHQQRDEPPMDPLSHVCRAGNNLNSMCLMIKWLPAAGHIATSRPRSGGPLTGPPGPVQAYFESQQPHGSLSVLPHWPWRSPSQPAMSAKHTERSLYLSWGPGRAR